MADHLTAEQRWAIVNHANAGHSTREIARLMHCQQSTVARTLQRYRQTGDVSERHGRGRSTFLAEDIAGRLHNIIQTNPSATSPQIADMLDAQTGRRISPRTIRRARRVLGYHPVHRQAIPELADHHKDARLAYAREHRRDDWKYVIFCDEAMFTLDYRSNIYWIRDNEMRPRLETQTYPVRVHVWAAIWWTGKATIHITSRHWNSQTYTNCLQHHLLPTMPRGRRYLFLQDNATVHTSEYTLDWLTQHNIAVVPNYPVRSPDFNPMEHVWAWMKHFVAHREPVNRRQLKMAIRHAWTSLPTSHRHSYIRHLEYVVRRCIAVRGDYTE
jgi:transposase